MRHLKLFSLLSCIALAGCSGMGSLAKGWSLPDFGKDKPAVAAQPAAEQKSGAVALQAAWLSEMHARVNREIAGTSFRAERRGDAVVVIAMIDAAFNPDRPGMLLPATLTPLTRVAKLAAADPMVAVVVLGQGDRPEGVSATMQGLGSERATNIASIFRLSGMGRDRLFARGVAFSATQQQDVDARGRVRDRRIEMVLLPRDRIGINMLSLNR